MECIVCWDDKDCYKLECNHFIHLRCASQLFSIKCPLCQREMNNLPQDCKDSINKNDIERQRELDNEDREAAEEYNRLTGDLENILSTQFRTPQLEMMIAMSALRGMGIPLRFLPGDISIEIERDQPNLRYGVITEHLGMSVLQRINDELRDFEDDSDSIDDGTSDDEDIFREDDMINSRRLLPRVNIIRK